MKQILRYSLVTLMAMIGLNNAFADEVTMKYSGSSTTNMTGGNDAALLGLNESAWSVIGDKGANSNFPGLNKAGDFRLYYSAEGGNTITVSSLNGATINTIAITFTDDSYSNVSVTAGGNAVTGTAGVYSINSGSFVLGNANTSNVQVRISQIVITYTAGSSSKTATTIEFSGNYETRATCGKDESVSLPTATVKASGTAVSGATVTWESDKTDIATVSGNKLNIANGTQGEVTIKASYAGNDTYEASSKTYKLTVYKGGMLLSEMVKDVTSSNEKWDNGGELYSYWFVNDDFQSVPNTVTYANGKYIYLTDGTSNLLFYGTNSQNLKQGDVISGDLGNGERGAIWGKLYRYNKLPEFSFTEMNVKVESQGATVTPTTITADKLGDNLNNYVKIVNAEYVSTNNKTITFKVGDETLTVYNQFEVDATGLEAGAKYTLTGMGAVYKTTNQLYLTSFTKEDPANINLTTADANADAPVYNLKGQKVEAGYKGLVIKNGKKMIQK